MTEGISARMPLSPRFGLPAFTRSDTAEKLGLYNLPREVNQVENLKALCRQVLEPVTDKLGREVRILSGFRCATLNRLIGEPADSQNMLGEAADILTRGLSAYDAAFTIAAWGDLPFDRLALVHRTLRSGAVASYLHLSHRRMAPNRHRVETWFIAANGRRCDSGVLAAGEPGDEKALRHVA